MIRHRRQGYADVTAWIVNIVSEYQLVDFISLVHNSTGKGLELGGPSLYPTLAKCGLVSRIGAGELCVVDDGVTQ
jgi:hypothetical protein